MIRATVVLVLFVWLTPLAADEPLPAKAGLISFGDSFAQTPKKLSTQWHELSEEKRKAISQFLLGRLGLSSTGEMRLIGVYRDTTKEESDEKIVRVFHFRQLDLFGSRLFWSVLVYPEAETARVIYHINPKRITGKEVDLKASDPTFGP